MTTENRGVDVTLVLRVCGEITDRAQPSLTEITEKREIERHKRICCTKIEQSL